VFPGRAFLRAMMEDLGEGGFETGFEGVDPQ
jgi:hypothetical protein